MSRPWSNRPFPGPEPYTYAPLENAYVRESLRGDGIAGSDPATMRASLFEHHGLDAAILVPLTRGLHPNVDFGSAIASATNRWLVADWLDPADDGARLYGTIRVNPSDPVAAVAEIERWAGDPRMVQIGVPVQAHHPYGQRLYVPIWEAAAAHGLPVVLHGDGGASVDFPPSPVGFFRHPVEVAAFGPLNVAFHLASLVAEGIFERLPTLRVVCADGGLSAFMPILWRMNSDWRSQRDEIPWVTSLPIEYIRRHVRFVLHRADAPLSVDDGEWWSVAHANEMLMYGGNYPFADYLAPSEAAVAVGPDLAHAVLAGNATALYGLGGRRPA